MILDRPFDLLHWDRLDRLAQREKSHILQGLVQLRRRDVLPFLAIRYNLVHRLAGRFFGQHRLAIPHSNTQEGDRYYDTCYYSYYVQRLRHFILSVFLLFEAQGGLYLLRRRSK